MGKRVIIVGGGIAGLAAASRLKGWEVTLLEAKERLGGRIHTINSTNQVVELGAEFVHGHNKTLLRLIEDAGLKIRSTSENQLLFDGRKLEPVNIWEDFGKLMGEVDPLKPDESIEHFLNEQRLSQEKRELMMAFATGFNAAHADKLSTHSLKLADYAAEQQGGDKQSRITEGYGSLVNFLAKQAGEVGVRVHLNTVVNAVKWRRGSVEVEVQNGGTINGYSADAALITLPLGVLKANQVKFEPPLTDKTEAIEGMEFGNVVKVVFLFKSVWWPKTDFGFINALDDSVSTWWSKPRSPIIVGWAGGAKADALLDMSQENLEKISLGILAKIFQKPESEIEKELLSMKFHNWAKDPHVRGAYSYVPVKGLIYPKILGAPVDDTLFFAGEATGTDAQLGTVFTALESGYRAAREIVDINLGETNISQ